MAALGGAVPAALAVSACAAPALRSGERYAEPLDDARLIADLREQGGTPEAVFAEPELLRITLDVLRADYRLCHGFRRPDDVEGAEGTAPLSCPVHIFGGRADRIAAAELQAWARETRGPSTLDWFGGGHFFLREEEDRFLRTLAARMTALGAARGAVPGGHRPTAATHFSCFLFWFPALPGAAGWQRLCAHEEFHMNEMPMQFRRQAPEGSELPLLITPNRPGEGLLDAFGRLRPRIEEALPAVGGVLLRGFDVPAVETFQQFAAAFGDPLLKYEFASTPRSAVEASTGAGVYTSTEYPAHQTIPPAQRAGLHPRVAHAHLVPLRDGGAGRRRDADRGQPGHLPAHAGAHPPPLRARRAVCAQFR